MPGNNLDQRGGPASAAGSCTRYAVTLQRALEMVSSRFSGRQLLCYPAACLCSELAGHRPKDRKSDLPLGWNQATQETISGVLPKVWAYHGYALDRYASPD